MAVQKSTDRQQPEILFVHNTLMWYTEPFFMRLSETCHLKLVFTDMELGRSIYQVSTYERGEEPDTLRYKVMKRYFTEITPSGVPLGLLKELFSEQWQVTVADLGSVEMLLCFLAARLKRKPVILKCGAWGWQGKTSGKTLGSPFRRFFAPRADAIVVPGTKHKEYAVALGASPDKVFIMPYASNITIREEDYGAAEKLRGELGIGTGKVILYVGRLVQQKGIDYLLEAFASLKKEHDDIVLVIVGEGESKGALELLAKRLGIEGSVHFTGFVLNEQVMPYYLLCDVCLVPSITCGQADVWARTVNDAMYAGKPVIATEAVGAAYDMIQDGINGFTVPEQDSQALYKAIKQVISEPELAKRMGEASKRIVTEGFTYEHMAAGFLRAVESVTK